jgi:DNA-binding NtrC family response regulator
MEKVFVVYDETENDCFTELMTAKGFKCRRGFNDGDADSATQLEQESPGVVFYGFNLNGLGMENVVSRLRDMEPTTPVIMLTTCAALDALSLSGVFTNDAGVKNVGGIQRLANALDMVIRYSKTSAPETPAAQPDLKKDTPGLSSDSTPDSLEEFFNRTGDAEKTGNDSFSPLKVERYRIVAEMERKSILKALDAVNGSKTKTAKLLGISRKNLWEKMKKHGIDNTGRRKSSV